MGEKIINEDCGWNMYFHEGQWANQVVPKLENRLEQELNHWGLTTEASTIRWLLLISEAKSMQTMI